VIFVNLISSLHLKSLLQVRSCSELRAVAALLPPSFKPYMIGGRDTSTGQNVGLLTKIDPVVDLWRTEARASYPVKDTMCGAAVPDDLRGSGGQQGVSKHYVAEFDLGRGLRLALVGAHLLAQDNRSGSVRCWKREAQAEVLRDVVVGLAEHGNEVILLGDLNDLDRDALPGRSADSMALSLLRRGRSGVDPSNPPNREQLMASWPCSDLVLLNPTSYGYPQQNLYTAWSDRNRDCIIDHPHEVSVLDYVLTSEGLQGAVTAADIPLWYGPVHELQKMCKDDKDYVSDHWPVVLDLNLNRVRKQVKRCIKVAGTS
jgi:exonuclease III